MKKRLLLLFAFIVCFLFSCTSSTYTHPVHPEYTFSDSDTKMIIVSDTHYLASSLFDSTRDFDAEHFVKDGRTMNYNNRVMDELLNIVLEEKPDYFVITGDISYNGARASHEELALKLESLKQAGIQPLVIPGNHDTYILQCFDYSDKEYRKVPSVNADEFANIYAAFGYEGGISYAPNSLSYVYETENDEWLFLLDTTISKYNEEENMNLVGGYFEDLDWLEENLRRAEELGKTPICFSHHNLLTHHPSFTLRYTIENANDLLELYKRYHVKMNFSGHLHVQDIVEQEGVFDISSNSTIVFGNRYGVLDISKEHSRYESKCIDFELEDTTFRAYSEKLFLDTHIQNHKGAGELDELVSKINAYYFDGGLLDHPEFFTRKLLREMNKRQDTDYMKRIVETRSKDNYHLFIEFETE